MSVNIPVLSNSQINFSENNKIYIKDHQLYVGKPGLGTQSGLPCVTEKIRSLIGENPVIINPTLSANLKNWNEKIKKRNKKIADSTTLKCVDAFLKFISQGKFSLTVKELEFSSLEDINMPSSGMSSRKSTVSTQAKAVTASPQTELKNFEERVDDLMSDGPLFAINKSFDSILKFEPDIDVLHQTPSRISRSIRAELVVKALQVAPPQPEKRPFEYVGFGAGAMRQDLHQVMGLIDQGVTNLHISLIDTEYAPSVRTNSPRHDYEECVKEFQKIINRKYPETVITIDLYPSTDDWLTKNEGSPIDLLTAVRVEVTYGDVMPLLEQLEENLADDSGIVVSNASNRKLGERMIKENEVVIERCYRNKEEVKIEDVQEKEKKLKLKAFNFISLGHNLSKKSPFYQTQQMWNKAGEWYTKKAC